MSTEIGRIESEAQRIHDQAEAGNFIGLAHKLSDAYQSFVTLQRQELKDLVSKLKSTRDASQHGPAVWDAFDKAMKLVNDSLVQMEAMKPDSPEIFGALRVANRRIQLAPIEQLAVLVNISRPSDIAEQEWEDWKNQYHVVDYIEKTKTAYYQTEPDVEKAYQEAKEQFLNLQIETLNRRIEQVRELVRSCARFVNQVDWEKELKTPLFQAAIATLTSLPLNEQEPVNSRDKAWREAREKFMQNRLAALSSALKSVNKHLPATGQTEIQAQLTAAENAWQEANKKLSDFIQSSGQANLARADEAGITAQQEYKLLSN
jgi:hypothetical protein